MRLLLLPGMDGTGVLFAPFLRELPATLTPQIVTFPTREPLGYAELFQSVERVANQLEDDYIIVAESFSDPLALMLAARQPPRLRGVVLCATFVQSPSPMPAFLSLIAGPWMFNICPKWIMSWPLLGRKASEELVRLLDEVICSVSRHALTTRVRAVANVDVRSELKNCRVPMLYLSATNDWLVGPRNARQVRSIRPDIEFARVAGPHLILQTAPKEVATVLASFCARVS